MYSSTRKYCHNVPELSEISVKEMCRDNTVLRVQTVGNYELIIVLVVWKGLTLFPQYSH